MLSFCVESKIQKHLINSSNSTAPLLSLRKCLDFIYNIKSFFRYPHQNAEK
jgi:hypothetical protein